MRIGKDIGDREGATLVQMKVKGEGKDLYVCVTLCTPEKGCLFLLTLPSFVPR